MPTLEHALAYLAGVVQLALALALPRAAAAATRTTTTTYAYNADGAPTAVTTQVDTRPATTIYLTWDNFTPDTAQPATGTVSAANANLIGIGVDAGATGSSRGFAYDDF